MCGLTPSQRTAPVAQWRRTPLKCVLNEPSGGGHSQRRGVSAHERWGEQENQGDQREQEREEQRGVDG